MSATSVDWLLWMAGTTALYWLAPGRWRDLVLVLVSIAFMATYDLVSAGLLVAMMVCTFHLTRGQELSGLRTSLIAAVIIAILAGFKIAAGTYLGAGGTDSVIVAVAVPVGLSYYSFRCLHYLIERYKDTLSPPRFFDFAAYLGFLPTFLAGPIHRFPEFNRDRHAKRWSAADLSEGLERILYGYVKIIVLGNFLVSRVLAEWIAMLGADQAGLAAYATLLRRAFNLYFQFSGYSDVAIGFALLLGYRVMENFNWPFLKRNISEFWRSWHMSLTSWVRDYVYTVVFATSRSPALAAVVSMLALGLWHEISFRYVVWGAYHGLGIVVWQRFQKLKRRLPRVDHPVARCLLDGASILLTFHFVVFGFSLVNEADLASATRVWGSVLFWWL